MRTRADNELFGQYLFPTELDVMVVQKMRCAEQNVYALSFENFRRMAVRVGLDNRSYVCHNPVGI